MHIWFIAVPCVTVYTLDENILHDDERGETHVAWLKPPQQKKMHYLRLHQEHDRSHGDIVIARQGLILQMLCQNKHVVLHA